MIIELGETGRLPPITGVPVMVSDYADLQLRSSSRIGNIRQRRLFIKLRTFYLYIVVDGCSTPAGWQLRGHYIDSGFGHSDDVNLDLEVETAGFAGNRGLVSRIATEVGSVTIDFEMDCEGSCEFTMFEVSLIIHFVVLK